jgi:hypothetical protein
MLPSTTSCGLKIIISVDFETKDLLLTSNSERLHKNRVSSIVKSVNIQTNDVIMEEKLENLSIENEDEWKSEDEWHETEGVPRLEDPFIQQYLTGRDALVAQEKKQRSG